MDPHLLFLIGFLRNPLQVSSIIPTSATGARRICTKIRLDGTRKVIVEYGPGTGVIVKELVKDPRLTADSKIILIEKDPEFAHSLKRRIRDPRVTVVCDGAENVETILQSCGETHADAVLSSIPLSIMPPDLRSRIIETTRAILRDDGVFIVFLFRQVVARYLRPVFPHVTMERVWWNIPPLLVFESRKKIL